MTPRAYRLYVPLLLTLALVACQLKRPGYVLSDSEMVDVLVDYHIAKAMGEELPAVETHMKVLYVEAALSKHGLTQQEFDTTMAWFSRHPDVLTKVYEKVSEKLKADRDELNHLMSLRNQQPTESAEGDTVDVWPWQRVHRLSRQPLTNKITFTLESDINYRDDDTLQWIARFSHMGGRIDTLHAAAMALHIDYADPDTTLTSFRRILSDGTDTLTLSADSFGTLIRVSGYIYFPAADSLDNSALLVDRISLMRLHATVDSTAIDSTATSPAGDNTITVVVDTEADTDSAAVDTVAKPADKQPAARQRPSAENMTGRTAASPAPSKKVKAESDKKKATNKKSTSTRKKNTKKKSTSKKTPAKKTGNSSSGATPAKRASKTVEDSKPTPDD